MAALRVLIVDDDPVFRRIITRTLEDLPQVEVAGTAATMAIARRKLLEGGIDAVTIDVVLDGESGLDLLSWVRQAQPSVVPILITAGSKAGARTDVDATLLGAAALVLKTAGPRAQTDFTSHLGRVVGAIVKRRQHPPVGPAPVAEVIALERDLIAVGASTGGPPVVLGLLKRLGRDFTVPIAIVQHMPIDHVPHFAGLLQEQTGFRVAVARPGEVLQPGSVTVAGNGKHLVVDRRGLDLVTREVAGPEEHNCRPAVDPLFRSVAAACGPRCVGVVMSGMGSDGALGAVELRRRGAPVVVQDEATSIVWGMPGATVARGGATVVAPADELASWVRRWTRIGGNGDRV